MFYSFLDNCGHSNKRSSQANYAGPRYSPRYLSMEFSSQLHCYRKSTSERFEALAIICVSAVRNWLEQVLDANVECKYCWLGLFLLWITRIEWFAMTVTSCCRFTNWIPSISSFCLIRMKPPSERWQSIVMLMAIGPWSCELSWVNFLSETLIRCCSLTYEHIVRTGSRVSSTSQWFLFRAFISQAEWHCFHRRCAWC